MSKSLNVCIVGAGLMGHGIAQVFAQAGHRVSLHDPNIHTLEKAPERIELNLRQMGLNPDPILANIILCPILDHAAANAGIVIEAIPELLEVKQALFAELSRLVPADAILASNTSVIPVALIGEHLSAQARSRLVGTHWWNPPHLVPLVEVVCTEFTDPAVFDATFALIESIGKSPVKVLRDVPGFIGNRLQHAMWREALHLLSEGVCSAETIDIVVKQSFGRRLPFLGPMENIDLVGVPLTQQVHQVIFPHLCNDMHPNPLLDSLLDQGHTGMSSGQGVRNWTEEEARNVHNSLSINLINFLKTFAREGTALHE